jgi:hypothetical protein
MKKERCKRRTSGSGEFAEKVLANVGNRVRLELRRSRSRIQDDPNESGRAADEFGQSRYFREKRNSTYIRRHVKVRRYYRAAIAERLFVN